MAFEKGRKKTGGRKKGVQNRDTTKLRSLVAKLVETKFNDLSEKFDRLSEREQIDFLTKLLPYVIPKQNESKVTIDEGLTESIQESMDRINEMFDNDF